MLIGCITGPDFATAKSQIEMANSLCNGIELRLDLLETEIAPLLALAKGEVLITQGEQSQTIDGKTISIYHNFDETPQDLDAILEKMPKADIYKIATMANSTIDALRMLCFVQRHKNVAGMCMGPLGQITRILGPVVGGPLTFAAIGKETAPEAAPGQLQAEELASTYFFHKLTPKTQIYGLIGSPITQSPSHKTHNAYFQREGIDAVYVKMELKKPEIPLFFKLAKQLGIRGLSITAPFKEALFEEVDHLEEDIGAINTLTFQDNQIFGANTDGIGALDALEEQGSVAGKLCVILGAGGAAKAIAYEAKKRGAKIEILSRRYDNLSDLGSYDILINTTPHPCPIDLEKLQARKVVMDICFRDEESSLMIRAKALGNALVYAEDMFKRQALGQFSRWNQMSSV